MADYLHILVARGHTILVEVSFSGSHSQNAQSILQKLPLTEPSVVKRNVPHPSYADAMFRYFQKDNIIVMALTSNHVENTKSYALIAQIYEQFMTTYGDKVKEKKIRAKQFAGFADVIRKTVNDFSATYEDKLDRAAAQTQQILEDTKKNIDKLVARNENVAILVDKTDELDKHSINFSKKSRTLSRKVWWQSKKWTICLYIFVAIVCIGIIFYALYSLGVVGRRYYYY